MHRSYGTRGKSGKQPSTAKRPNAPPAQWPGSKNKTPPRSVPGAKSAILPRDSNDAPGSGVAPKTP